MSSKDNETDKVYGFDDLVCVMAKLRDPNGGCPWDLEQSYKTIAPYTIEEAYEVADAIDREDMNDLREELGDLLFQPIYHAQMACEEKHFDIYDVIHDVTHKMVERHPHVFGERDAQSAEDVNAIWDERKAKEKHGSKSALDGVTAALPSLLKAQKLQKKAAKVGFEWPEITNVLDKLEEELSELRVAVENGTIEQKQDEIGDVLFVMANLARMLGLNAEESLRQCNNKFERRFRGLEADIVSSGRRLEDASLQDMEAGWNEQKKKEAAG